MPGSTSGALFTGFLVGSALTASAAYVYLTQNYVRATSKEEDENGTTTTSSRGLAMPSTNMTSSSAAAVVAHGEHVGFLTDMMAKLWPYIKEAGAASIKESVEPEFASLPGPLAKLRFTKVDLGTVPIRMDNVVMHKTDEKNNTLQFDLDVIWDGNCDIQLKGGMGVAFGVKSVKLQGRMSILLKPLTTDLSIVRGVQYSFINPPDLELDFTGLAQLADFSVVDKKIRGVLQDTMKSMIVLPERMLYKMDLACSFLDIYRPPLGVVCVTAVDGKGFVVEKRALRKDDVPDTYLNISMGGGVVRSKTIKDSLKPVWNESFEFMMNDLDQIISIEAMDEDGGPLDPDDHLGTAHATIGEIMLSGGYKELHLSNNLTSNGASVTLGCQMVNFTSDLSSLKESASDNLLAGVLVILVVGAFDVPLQKKDAATFVAVEYKDKSFVTSAVIDYPGVDALNPAYDIAFHLPLSLSMVKDGTIEDIKFRLMNGATTELGSMKVTHSEVVAAPANVLTEKRAIGKGGASLHYRVALYGLDRVASDETMAPPASLGVSTKKSAALAPTMNLPRQGGATPSQMRVTAVSAHGFKIKKKRGLKKDDVPDCYCIIKVGSSASQWRTKTIKNSVSPVWKESKEYAFVNHGQTIQIDVWDANSGRFTKDDYVGCARATVGEFLLKGGSLEMEVKAEGTPTGNYVVVKCELIN